MKPIALVLGCTGQDGSYLCKSLIQKGFEVFGTSRKEKPELKRLLELGIADKTKLICCDLENFHETRHTINKLKPSEI